MTQSWATRIGRVNLLDGGRMNPFALATNGLGITTHAGTPGKRYAPSGGAPSGKQLYEMSPMGVLGTCVCRGTVVTIEALHE